jgi:hypothetical protein
MVGLFACSSLFGETALTRLTKNDPYPLYSSSNPYEFLNRCYENDITDYCEPCDNRFFRMAFSAFRQTAKLGTDIEENEDTNLGDLVGRWNVIGLFYDPEAAQKLIKGLDLDASSSFSVGSCIDSHGIDLITDPAGADPNQRFGFFDVPLKYRKYGVRLDTEVALPLNFTIGIKTGVAHIWQEPRFIDLTCSSTGIGCPIRDCPEASLTNTNLCPPISQIDTSLMQTGCADANCCIGIASCACKELVIDKIMKQKEKIERILHLHLDENLFISSPYDKTGFEDIEFNLNWSRMFAVNKNRCDWPFFVITPFVTLGFTVPTSGPVDRRNPFALPLGNDGHWSYGGRAGLNIDFVETLTVSGEAGLTGFTPRCHANVPIPTNELQSGIFPEQASVRIQPGLNWHFAFMLSSYRFLDRLSSWVQYAVVHHDKDEFEPLFRPPDSPPLLIRKLHDESQFRFHVINGALNYEISPHVQFGFVWQIPIFQQNAYRSTTFMITIQVAY